MPKRFWRIPALVCGLVCLLSQDSTAALEPVRGRVTQVRVDRGEVRITLPIPGDIRVGDRGRIQSRSGPVDIRVTRVLPNGELRAREERQNDLESVRTGDSAILFAGVDRIERETNRSLTNLDQLLTRDLGEPLELAPDFLAEVSGTTLDDYEAWLQILERERIDLPTGIEPVEAIRTYPDMKVSQIIRTGVDYDRFVFNATAETGGEQVREQIGRFFRWNYIESGDLWKGQSLRFENEFEANDTFLYEEMNLLREYELPGGDRFWWENRVIWKVFLNDQGDPFFLNDFEARYVKKLSDKWDWQAGLVAVHKREYNTDSDDGFTRLTLLSEWNYQEGWNKWFDLTYELTRDVKNDREENELDYWEHSLRARYLRFEGDWSFDFYGEFFYRDENQPRNEHDVFSAQLTARGDRKINDRWRFGLRTDLNTRAYPTTSDINSNGLRAELAPFATYAKDGKFSVRLEPRVAQVFNFGNVGDAVPSDKSDGDFREAGLDLSVSWYPNEKWRVYLYQDTFHRWFPHGETNQIPLFLYDSPLLADSTYFRGGLTVDYLCWEALELSFRLSHTRQIYDTFDEHDTESFNVGIEAVYRY